MKCRGTKRKNEADNAQKLLVSNERDRDRRQAKGAHEPSGKKNDRSGLKKDKQGRKALFRGSFEEKRQVQKDQAPRKKRTSDIRITHKKDRCTLAGQGQHGAVPHQTVFLQIDLHETSP